MTRVPAYTLQDKQELVELRHQLHGRGYGYVVADRFGGVLLCEKLPWAAIFINQMGGDRVSVASLYEAAKYGRLVHHRFSCKRMPLVDVPSAFREERRKHPGAKAVVLGWRDQVTVTVE